MSKIAPSVLFVELMLALCCCHQRFQLWDDSFYRFSGRDQNDAQGHVPTSSPSPLFVGAVNLKLQKEIERRI